MANTIYPLALQGFLGKTVDTINDTIKAMLVTSGYVYSASHQYVTDVGGGNIIVRGATGLASKTDTGGVFTGANFTFSSVGAGSTVAGIIIYDDSPSTDATKPLLAFIDHDGGGLPISIATTGGNITVNWNASGIFSI